ncbi:MAG TPA: hypothetical protein VM639_06240 [Dongiaceae bacterium]|nr:hypothetical protein [Dongiaceae bacterium]
MTSAAKITFEELERLDRQARQKVAGIRRLFTPDLQALRRAGNAAATSDQQHDLRNLKVALALADLTDLRDSLKQYRDLIVAEIRQHNCAQSAVAAYAKSLHGTKVRRSH